MPSGNILERLVRFPGLLSPPPTNIDYGKDESYHTVTPEHESSEHTERHFARSLKNRQTLADYWICRILWKSTLPDTEISILPQRIIQQLNAAKGTLRTVLRRRALHPKRQIAEVKEVLVLAERQKSSTATANTTTSR
ncbi:MAG: hypothetical protein Q9221_005135 [Calogaya cf. arnoldii]